MDQSQIEYYSQNSKAIPGRVLGKNHSLVEKVGSEYRVNGFENLTPHQIDDLLNVCQVRLNVTVQTTPLLIGERDI